MSTSLKTLDHGRELSLSLGEQQSFVTMRVCEQLFGISVLTVQDVLRAQRMARIPLAPREVAGSLNLRGRIVTVVDMRTRLSVRLREKDEKVMHVVVEFGDELYSLLVDSVGDVLSLPLDSIEKIPANLESSWRDISAGIFRLDKELLVILDVQAILTF